MARTRPADRAAGALLALGLQAVFMAALLHAVMAPPPGRMARELMLVLPRLRKADIVMPRGRSRREIPLPFAPPQTMNAVPQAVAPDIDSAMRNFGQALNECAPEHYASLTPEQRVRCLRPGDGVAIQQAPALLGTPPQAQDEALWQEQWAEDHWKSGLCTPDEEMAVECIMHQSIAESERAADVQWHLARAKAAALKPPPAVLAPPKN